MRVSKLRSRQPRSREQGHSNNLLNGKHDDTSLSVPVGQYHSKRGGIHGQTTAFRLHRTESQAMVSPNRSPACSCWGRACLSCVCCSLAALRNHFFCARYRPKSIAHLHPSTHKLPHCALLLASLTYITLSSLPPTPSLFLFRDVSPSIPPGRQHFVPPRLVQARSNHLHRQ